MLTPELMSPKHLHAAKAFAAAYQKHECPDGIGPRHLLSELPHLEGHFVGTVHSPRQVPVRSHHQVELPTIHQASS